MKSIVLHRKIIHEVGQSFSYSDCTPFNIPLHCHDEYELIYIKSGHGQEFIGDAVKRYDTGDLILIGGNVPHLHLCDSITNGTKEQLGVCEILQFPREIFPENLGDVQEYSSINLILDKSHQGIKFHSKKLINNVLKIMRSINERHGIERIISLFEILDLLGKSKDTSFVSSLKYTTETLSYTNKEPVSMTYNYLLVNFKNTITLEEIADYVKLNAASLCRHFKARTEKTIFECLNEIRIEHACRLLTHSNLSVSQVGYNVGYNNLSHFNKQFKDRMRQTPTDYKKNLMTKIHH